MQSISADTQTLRRIRKQPFLQHRINHQAFINPSTGHRLLFWLFLVVCNSSLKMPPIFFKDFWPSDNDLLGIGTSRHNTKRHLPLFNSFVCITIANKLRSPKSSFKKLAHGNY